MSAQAVDLSSIPATPPTEEAPEEQPERPPLDVATAFTVALSGDGVWVVLNDPNLPVRLHRAPTPDDMYAGCAVVQRDLTGQVAAMHTQRAMLALTQQIQQQQQASNIASKLGNLRG